MLRVTVEIYPHGRIRGRETLATIDIVNDGSGDWRHGNYTVDLEGRRTGYRMARVEGHDRDLPAVVLVHKALSALLEGES